MLISEKEKKFETSHRLGGVNVEKSFVLPSLTLQQNKLERLSLASS
jgi:hypothetical protein